MGDDNGSFGFVVGLAAVAGGLYLAYALSKSKDAKVAPIASDEGPSTNVSHGAFLPYVLGRGRVGVYYLWTGVRTTEVIPSGAAAGGGGGGGVVTKGSKKKKSRATSYITIYIENTFGGICVGPAEELVDIYFAGKSMLIGEESPAPTFTSTSHPSGTALPVANSKGTIRSVKIYWGELDQPSDPELVDPVAGTGSTSRWPLNCYLSMRAVLGQTPRWPLIDIEIMTTIQDTGSVVLAASTPKITGTTYTDGRQGLNGAHMLAQLLFGGHPYGLALDPALFDIPSLEVLGTLLQTEGILSSITASAGESFQAMIGHLMQDLSVMISWDQALGKWRFVPIRVPTNVPIIPSDMVKSRPLELQVRHADQPAEKISFRFFDVDRRFRPGVVDISSDSSTIGDRLAKTKTVQIRSTVDFQSASKIAERRSQEALGQESKYKITLDRNAAALYPGRAFFLQGTVPRLLTRTVKLDPLTGAVEVTAMEDSMSVDLTTFFLNPPPDSPPLIIPAASDTGKKILEIPLFMLGASDPPGILVPRIRANKQIITADIHLSDDNITYSVLGSTSTIQAGGVLATALPVGAGILTTGPTLTLLGAIDDSVFQDLSTNLAAWRAGDQVVCIGEELMFVQQFVSLGGGQWRMDGILRNRMGTVQAAHAVNDTTFVFDPQVIFDGSDSILVSGNQVFVKTRPASGGAATDLAAEVAVSRTLYMTGHRPLPPNNLRVDGNVNAFQAGNDVLFRWSYKSRLGGPIVHGGNGSGAGMANSGQGVSTTAPEGDRWVLRFYDDPTGANTLVRTEFVLAPTTPAGYGSQTFNYTNANLVADMGAEEDFAVEITEEGNALESSPPLRVLVSFV